MLIAQCRKLSTMSVQKAKQIAAHKAVDTHIKCDSAIGIGSGSTVVFVVERLAERVAKENLNVVCVPTSFQSKQLIVQHRLKLGDLETHPHLAVCIDGADEVDSNLTLIKGGGGCLLQEKVVASCADSLIIVADYTKNSTLLGQQYKKGIPIEVAPIAYLPISQRIEKTHGGNVELRMAVNKAGPVITDNGNFILDWKNFNQALNWEKINFDLCMIPGVIETGLFVNMAEKAYFGMADGSVKEQERLEKKLQ